MKAVYIDIFSEVMIKNLCDRIMNIQQDNRKLDIYFLNESHKQLVVDAFWEIHDEEIKADMYLYEDGYPQFSSNLILEGWYLFPKRKEFFKNMINENIPENIFVYSSIDLREDFCFLDVDLIYSTRKFRIDKYLLDENIVTRSTFANRKFQKVYNDFLSFNDCELVAYNQTILKHEESHV